MTPLTPLYRNSLLLLPLLHAAPVTIVSSNNARWSLSAPEFSRSFAAAAACMHSCPCVRLSHSRRVKVCLMVYDSFQLHSAEKQTLYFQTNTTKKKINKNWTHSSKVTTSSFPAFKVAFTPVSVCACVISLREKCVRETEGSLVWGD